MSSLNDFRPIALVVVPHNYILKKKEKKLMIPRMHFIIDDIKKNTQNIEEKKVSKKEVNASH